MIKTLARSIKQEKENFRIPHSVQDVIPIRRIWLDGIFQAGNAYSRSYRLTDINYAIASKADKTAMLLDYSELLNALDSGACAKITINNRRVDRRQFEQELLIRPQEDKLNEYRQEYNDMLRSHAASNNNVVQERYLTISAHKRSVDEARAYFQRMGGEVTARLGQLSSQAEELDASARLQILRDFFKAGQPAVVPFNMEQRAKRGHDFKDWFCPDSLEFYADFFKSDIRWGRVLYLQDYASFIKDDFIMELCELDRSMMVSIDILPVPTDEAVRELQNKLLGVETNVAGWQRRQNNANNYTANVPYDMQLQRKETTEFLNDLTERDQRMMYGLVTVVHLAESKEQLDADTESLLAVGRKHLCQLSTLRWQQRDGLDTVLPYGVRRIHALRTLTTESVAVLMPFKAQELNHTNGIYYGQNAVSGNMIRIDRAQLLNGHSFRLGVSGSGKSMSAKEELVEIALRTKDDILILDPESEFGQLVKALGGEVLPISPHSSIHLNALDIDRAYGEGKTPLVDKVKLILSVFEPLTENGLTAKQRSILDRCARLVYREYMRDEFGPALGQAVRASGGIDLVTVLAKTAGMGDENHNRQPAASMYLALQIIPHFMDVEHPKKNDMVRFLAGNDRFFLHVMMAGVEALTVKAKEIPLSTVMAGMGGNGVEFGIQLSGTGNRWYTAPAPVIHGMLLKPSYTEEDLLGYLGDSCVTEVYGLGGMSSIAGPAYARFTGATFAEAKERTEKARAVSLGEHT